ncbi:TIGR03767 family metallophosphoesterase [Streptomyces sp. NPDC018045]|uniref:TIGR03767 family metallophosphoesterase n=1 Tax=Streptomyces sp. NPDC018045 TaxID=3365037 RepID=UPI0037AC9164
MSRTRSAAPAAPTAATVRTAPAVDRRAFLAAGGAVGATAALALAYGTGGARPATGPGALAAPLVAPEPVAAPPVPPVPYTEGTTLASVSAPGGGAAGYRRLAEGPGWGRVVRRDLAAAHPGRDDRRTVLAAFVQLTDLHLVDVQHPLRYEYLRVRSAGAWRPQEALSVAGAVSLVERVNSLPGGPATGAPLSFAMTTGDNTDNNAGLELDWFLTALSGGRITPNSGDPRHYEGVQNSGHPLYWQPDSALRDADKLRGFPGIPGFLAAATRTVTSPGLHLPWYSTVGNHDALPAGCCAPDDPFLAEVAAGGRKLELLPADEALRAYLAVRRGPGPGRRDFADLLRAHGRRARSVTPDERRVPFTRAAYLRAHLDPRYTGPGPHGHGYTPADLDADRLHYTFRIAENVVGISLDTTDPGGHHTGSIGAGQLRWLGRTLRAHAYEHVLVFSHHTSTSMDNTLPDPSRPAERRHGGPELLALLSRHRNVLAWINGHSHRNRVTPHGTFWEVTTASHIDFPQLARVVEVTDNRDGTLSLFTTLVESHAPHRTDFGDLSQRGLAALYRELSCNAPGARSDLAGGPGDRNTELLLGRR